jgi:hypothetical protein
MSDNSYFAPMSRCPECGRFMKRGLFNWIQHNHDHHGFKYWEEKTKAEQDLYIANVRHLLKMYRTQEQ